MSALKGRDVSKDANAQRAARRIAAAIEALSMAFDDVDCQSMSFANDKIAYTARVLRPVSGNGARFSVSLRAVRGDS